MLVLSWTREFLMTDHIPFAIGDTVNQGDHFKILARQHRDKPRWADASYFDSIFQHSRHIRSLFWKRLHILRVLIQSFNEHSRHIRSHVCTVVSQRRSPLSMLSIHFSNPHDSSPARTTHELKEKSLRSIGFLYLRSHQLDYLGQIKSLEKVEAPKNFNFSFHPCHLHAHFVAFRFPHSRATILVKFALLLFYRMHIQQSDVATFPDSARLQKWSSLLFSIMPTHGHFRDFLELVFWGSAFWGEYRVFQRMTISIF